MPSSNNYLIDKFILILNTKYEYALIDFYLFI